MSNRSSLARTLHSLLPTSSAIPPALLDYATALYAQSRSKAPTLKPDEEVARECVCCVLAAERLKQRLDLPAISPKPPCPPRVYKKLYQYLDGVLHNAIEPSKDSLPRKRALTANFQHSSAKLSKPTPRSSTSADTIPTADLTSKSQHLPDWVAPAIKHVCSRLKYPDANPHAYVGVAAVTKRDATADRMPALIIAICILVIEQLSANTGTFDDQALAKLAVEDMVGLRRVSVAKAGLCLSQAATLLEDDADSWKQMDWYRNIRPNGTAAPEVLDVLPPDEPTAEIPLPGDSYSPEPEPLSVDRASRQDPVLPEQRTIPSRDSLSAKPGVTAAKADHRLLPETYPKTGAGTMRQQRVDWLSEDRRADYVEWKAAMLERIRQMERA